MNSYFRFRCLFTCLYPMELKMPVFLDRHGRQRPRDGAGVWSLRAKRGNPDFFICDEYKMRVTAS